MEGGPRLSFVVPLLDEREGVEVLWRELAGAGERLVADGVLGTWEAVLVDDGSTDGTATALAALAADDPRVVVVHHPVNRGVGAAMATGLGRATGDVVLYTDADLPFDLSLVAGLIAPILDGRADVVSGRRRGRFREGRWRGIQSHVFNALVRSRWRLPLHDVNFACKAAARHGVPDRLTCTTSAADLEWLLWAFHRGLVIVQPVVDFEPRRWGRSTVGSLRTVPPILRELRHLPTRAPDS